MLDLNDISVFVQVVRAGSFAAAGRRLGMPSNTVSRRLQLLEESLGVRLLQRSTRQLNVTAAGREFFDRCAPGIEDIQLAGADLFTNSREPGGILRVAAPADFLDNFSMEWIGEFMRQYPKVQLEFQLSDEHVDLIAEGIDVAFRGGLLPDSSLVARKLGESHRGLLASPGYLERHGTPTSLEQLAQDHSCLSNSSAMQHALWRLEGPRGVETVRVTPRLCVNTAQGLLRATRAGLGIALLPTMIAAEDLRRGTLVSVLPHYQRDLSGFYAVYPNRRQLSLAVSALIEFVAKKVAGGACEGSYGAQDLDMDKAEAA
ncbi:LysR family transcriptional regulator [Herbaspirillum sp. RV1423]|uniref:LysR family transcriptional regulator n=1 Tax=Herbaspirillum sp. RV1423 TaxID=1443993 RepID=UPI0004B89302|nr:LysR family transcriptional regulator [Herbaspirillum sp. RV1423]